MARSTLMIIWGLILPILAQQNNIKIIVNSLVKEAPNITFEGAGVDIVNANIKKLFGFTEWTGIDLLRATGLTISTVRMDNTNNAHIINNCSLVKRIIKPVGYEVGSTEGKPQHSVMNYFENDSNLPAEFSIKMSYKITNTFSSSWSKTQDTTYGGSIDFEFDMSVRIFTLTGPPGMVTEKKAHGGVKSSAHYMKSTFYGESKTVTETKEIESNTGLKVMLPPNTTAVAEIEGEVGDLSVQIEYESTLEGDLVVTFTNKTVKCWPVGEVMAMGNHTNSVKSYETMNMNFFATSRVVVRDADTHSKMHEESGKNEEKVD